MTSRLQRALLAACATMAAAVVLAQQASNSSQTTTQSAAQSAQKAAADSKANAGSSATADSNATADAKATASAAAAAAQKKADDLLIRDARNAGFKPEDIRGNRMFCRTATELGSSFPVRTCYNEDQVKIKIQEYQAQRNQMEAAHNLGMQVH
ncbi:MAG TPA: hypothetical protein VFA39_01975 [Steroidobacteraceae bacterium]|nr:hypothetical protein [Steroidobacteraceae bacterium]